MFTELLSRLSSSDTMALICMSLVAITIILITLTKIISGCWSRVRQLELEASLKSEMLSLGLSVQEISSLVKVTNVGTAAESAPETTVEVVVRRSGEWVPGIILEAKDGQCFVHFIGHDESENEWVNIDSIRFRNRLGAPINTGERAEVTAESDGDWYSAIVLKSEPEKCFIQFVGYDSSENKWMSKSRIRFPAHAEACIDDLVRTEA